MCGARKSKKRKTNLEKKKKKNEMKWLLGATKIKATTNTHAKTTPPHHITHIHTQREREMYM